MSDSTSQRRQEERKSSGQTEFKQILAEKTEQLQNRSMENVAVSYGRNGQLYFGQTMQRAYN